MQFSEEAIREAKETVKEITKALVNGLRKAQTLGIQDMTTLEAEAYLKK